MDDFWIFLLVLFSTFCFCNLCLKCCNPRNRRRHRSSRRFSERSTASRERLENGAEEEKESCPTVTAIYDNDYVNAEIEIIRNDQLSIIEAVAIKTKQEKAYDSKEWSANCAGKAQGHNEENEEGKDQRSSSTDIAGDLHSNANIDEVIRVNTEDVIVVQSSSPAAPHQV